MPTTTSNTLELHRLLPVPYFQSDADSSSTFTTCGYQGCAGRIGFRVKSTSRYPCVSISCKSNKPVRFARFVQHFHKTVIGCAVSVAFLSPWSKFVRVVFAAIRSSPVHLAVANEASCPIVDPALIQSDRASRTWSEYAFVRQWQKRSSFLEYHRLGAAQLRGAHPEQIWLSYHMAHG